MSVVCIIFRYILSTGIFFLFKFVLLCACLFAHMFLRFSIVRCLQVKMPL